MISPRAAHILPVAHDVNTGTVYVLLGKERRVHGWNDSETWCDFGGRVDNAHDHDIEHTAAREFFEETCAVVSWGGSAPTLRVRFFDPRAALVRSACVFSEYDSFARALRSHEYIVRVVTNDRAHVTFVRVIPFDAALPHAFDVVWRELHARFFAQVVRPAQKARAQQPPSCVDPMCSEHVASVASLSLERAIISSQKSETQLTEDEMGELLVATSDEANASVTVRATYDDSPLSGSLLMRAHPSRKGDVVDGAFLEKKSIAWVPLDVLINAVARTDGLLRHDATHLERLRSSCIDRLRIVLNTLLGELTTA